MHRQQVSPPTPTPPRRKSKLWPRLKARTAAARPDSSRPREPAAAGRRWSTAALAAVAVVGLTFGLSFGFLLWDRDLRGSSSSGISSIRHVASSSRDDDVAGGAGGAAGELRLVKHFQSFREYATEMVASRKEILPVPLVDPSGAEGASEGLMTLPLATIIGVQV